MNVQEHAHYRSVGGTCQLQALDRLDVKFSAKEIMRDASSPDKGSMAKAKRHVRFLCGKERLINWYVWQKKKHKLVTTVDADLAGCPKTRRSTTCCISRLGQHVSSEVVLTQALVALSSCESELYAILRGTIESRFLCSLLSFFGHDVEH